MVKLHWGSFPSLLFLPIWEEKICRLKEKIFSMVLHSPLFSSYSQTEENSVFHSIFLLTFSIPRKFHPTKYSVNLYKHLLVPRHSLTLLCNKKKPNIKTKVHILLFFGSESSRITSF